MKAHNNMPFRIELPLPAFVLHPITAAVIAAVHVYFAAGHLSRLIGGEVEWTQIWKGLRRAGRCVRVSPCSHRAGLANTKFSNLAWTHKREAQQNRLPPQRRTEEYPRTLGVWMVAILPLIALRQSCS
jgi:hypothetical protein